MYSFNGGKTRIKVKGELVPNTWGLAGSDEGRRGGNVKQIVWEDLS